MAETAQTEELKRYIFLEMPENERDSIEERFFEDTDFFYEMVNLENSFIDSYVRENLTAADLKKFEDSLTKLPARRDKVATARTLQTYIAEKKVLAAVPSATIWQQLSNFFKSSGFQYAFGALTILLLCATVFLLYQNQRTRRELTALQNKQETEIAEKERILQQQIKELENLKQASDSISGDNEILNERIKAIEKQKERLEQELRYLRQKGRSPDNRMNSAASPPQPLIASFFLAPSGGKGGELKTITIKQNVSRIDLSLQIPDASQAVSFSIRLNGKRVGENLKTRKTQSGRRVLDVSLPAFGLEKGDYQLTVTGNDGFEDNYGFRLRKQ